MLWRMLISSVQADPDRVIFIEGSESIRSAELLERASCVARRLAAAGIGPGDAVGLLARGGTRTASCIYGILGAGGTVVPLNPAMRPGEVARALTPCRPKLLLAENDLLGTMGGFAPALMSVDEALLKDGRAGVVPDPGIDPNRPAFYLFSTGSTGRPKRVMRTHAMMQAEADQYQAGVKLTPEDRILGVAPLFHSYGICCVMVSAVRSGASARLFVEFRPDVVMECATKDRATVLAGSPFHYSIMCGLRPRPGTDMSSLRWCISCGVAAPEAVIARFRDLFGLSLSQLYGASEVGSVTLNSAADRSGKAVSAGTPLPGVEVKVVQEDGRPAPANQTGEIAVKSPAGSARYEDLPEMSAQCFRDGWFHSGDLGRLDEEGHLYVTGRVKLLINAGGNKVDPLEVESILQEHPAVAEAAVVGVPAAHGLESVKAVIVLRAPARGEELRAFCAERLVGYKVPRIIEFRDELPRSPTGKLLRKDLLGEDS